MEIQRVNLKLSKQQHQMLKELSDKQGFTMTGLIQHMIVRAYETQNQYQNLMSMMSEIQPFISLIQDNPEVLNKISSQLGAKVG
jgi:hypothetical protein